MTSLPTLIAAALYALQAIACAYKRDWHMAGAFAMWAGANCFLAATLSRRN